MAGLITAFSALLCFAIIAVRSDRVVKTSIGSVRGIEISTGEVAVEGFLGIPYAEPPLGPLRFKRPVSKTAWTDVFDASRKPPTCIQNTPRTFYFSPDRSNMTEDCLYLNIWAPYSKNTDLKPILIFIHGGAFNSGSSNLPLYDGAKLSKFGDILVANLNYRVGALGFFSSFTPDAEGNMGLYDQAMAIKWIKENAMAFGGDPDNIVLMGQSAGGWSSSCHITSPMMKNVFKRFILHSGAHPPIRVKTNENLLDASHSLAVYAGCANGSVTLKNDADSVVRCLMDLPAEKVNEAEGDMMHANPFTFFPRIGDEFYPRDAIDSMTAGDFHDGEMMLGLDEEEGTFFLPIIGPDYFGVNGFNKVQRFSKGLATQMIQMTFKLYMNSTRDIAKFYVNRVKNASTDAYIKAYADSLGDYLISCTLVFMAEFYAVRNPVYLYKFTRRPSSTILADWIGTTHLDDPQYVFGNPLYGNFTDEEEQLSAKMMKRWTAFIKTGNPNVPDELEWPQFTHEKPDYLTIDDKESLGTRIDENRCEIWRERFRSNITQTIIDRIKGSDAKAQANVQAFASAQAVQDPLLMMLYMAAPVLGQVTMA